MWEVIHNRIYAVWDVYMMLYNGADLRITSHLL